MPFTEFRDYCRSCERYRLFRQTVPNRVLWCVAGLILGSLAWMAGNIVQAFGPGIICLICLVAAAAARDGEGHCSICGQNPETKEEREERIQQERRNAALQKYAAAKAKEI